MAKLKSKKVIRENPSFDDVKDWYDKNLHPDTLDIENEEVYKHIYDEGRFPAIFQFTSCLEGDSLVTMHDLEQKRIDEIIPGDVVKTFHQGSKKFVDSRVMKSLCNGKRECIRLNFENDKSLVCTPDHIILTNNRGWVYAKDLTENDDIVEFVEFVA